MSRDDWYRRTTWAPDDERDFRTRLKRSRQKDQYLCIQASTLVSTGSPNLAGVALELVDEMITKHPTPIFLAGAHETRARCLLALERRKEAIDAFRDSMVAQRAKPNVKVNAYLRFAWTVGWLRMSEHFDEALAAMREFADPTDLVFPSSQYRYFGALAFICEGEGDADEAARWAQRALDAAAATASPFPRHKTVGLVHEQDKAVTTRLQRLARHSSPRAHQ